jgi:hypothetical protein
VSFSRFTRVLLLAPPLGSAFLGILGLLFSGLLLIHCGHIVDHGPRVAIGRASVSTVGSKAATANQPSGGSTPGFVSVQTAPSFPDQAQYLSRRGKLTSHREPVPTMFKRTVPAPELQFLNSFVSQPSRTVARDATFRELINAVTPYAPFHLGVDMPLANVMEGMLGSSEVPVQIRDGRYVMVVGQRTPDGRGRGRAFLWIDMQQGIVLGGIFFYPSNGEPSPTLTLFSSQISADSVHIAQLPQAFLQDFSHWTADASVPAPTARYFINASNKKSVLAHDEDSCSLSGSSAAPAGEACAEQKVEAVTMDRQADAFLARVHYASNGTEHTLSDPFQLHHDEAR